MKQLLLIRHAKSDWNNLALDDFDRPLNKRGNRDAPEMAERLLAGHMVPQLLVSSPALRALSTARHFAEVFNISDLDILTEQKIYEASVETLLQLINKFDNRNNFIALFGHNPGITNLVAYLCDANIYDMPTCALSLIEFPLEDWAQISANTGDQTFYDFPKNED